MPASEKIQRLMTLDDSSKRLGVKSGVEIFKRNLKTEQSYYLLDEILDNNLTENEPHSSRSRINRRRNTVLVSIKDLERLDFERGNE